MPCATKINRRLRRRLKINQSNLTNSRLSITSFTSEGAIRVEDNSSTNINSSEAPYPRGSSDQSIVHAYSIGKDSGMGMLENKAAEVRYGNKIGRVQGGSTYLHDLL
ncbi:hypothetical protein V2G26_004031 [Clonostachys chloroleuca]